VNPENRKPGNHGRAVAWLLYLLLLALTICFASSMVIYLVFERLVFGLLPVAPAGQIAILLAVVLGHTLTLWRRLPAALLEPARRVAAGLGMVPADGRELATFRMLGLSFVAVAALDLWRILSLGRQRDLLLPHGYEFMALLLLKVLLAVLLAWSALRASRGQRLFPRRSPAGKAGWPAGRLPQLVRTCLHAAILATAGMLCASALERHLPWQSVLGAGAPIRPAAWGAQLGAVAAVHLLRLPPATRRVLTAGLAAEAAGRLLLGEAAVLLVLGVVAMVEWFGLRGTAGAGWWNAARAAWAFGLGSLAGGMAGRLIGGVLFGLFGVAGPVTGEALGAVFLALAGYLYARSPAPSPSPSLLTTT